MVGFWWKLSFWFTDGCLLPLSLHCREKAGASSVVSSHKSRNRNTRASLSWHHLNIITSWKIHLQVSSYWRLGLWYINLGNYITSVNRRLSHHFSPLLFCCLHFTLLSLPLLPPSLFLSSLPLSFPFFSCLFAHCSSLWWHALRHRHHGLSLIHRPVLLG